MYQISNPLTIHLKLQNSPIEFTIFLSKIALIYLKNNLIMYKNATNLAGIDWTIFCCSIKADKMQENEKTTGLPLSLDLPRKGCELHPSIWQRNSVDSSFLVVGRLSRFKTAGSFKQLELTQLTYKKNLKRDFIFPILGKYKNCDAWEIGKFQFKSTYYSKMIK